MRVLPRWSTILRLCLAILVSLMATTAENQDVLTEFRFAAAQHGWLLVKLNYARATALLVSAGSEQILKLAPEYPIYQFASSASGRCLAYSVDGEIVTWSDLVKDTLFVVGENGVRYPTKGHFATVKGLALSPDCRKLAINGIYQEIDSDSRTITNSRKGLFVADVGSILDSVRLIAEDRWSDSYLGVSEPVFDVSWFNTSDTLAYSAKGAIYTYSIADGAARFLVAGTNPACSPDGKWLGYKGANGSPMLFSFESRQSEPLIKGVTCLWSVKWSPDGNFAIFSQYDRRGTVFQVCRMKDRTTAPIYHSGAPYSEARFGWITRQVLDVILAPGERVKAK